MSGFGTIVDDFAMTDPDGIGSFFSSSRLPALQGEGGFGPGDYSGGYTGSELGGGHAIYWGAFDDASSAAPSNHTFVNPHLGPGLLANQTISAVSTLTEPEPDVSMEVAIAEQTDPIMPPVPGASEYSGGASMTD